jgi:hypothetical protein
MQHRMINRVLVMLRVKKINPRLAVQKRKLASRGDRDHLGQMILSSLIEVILCRLCECLSLPNANSQCTLAMLAKMKQNMVQSRVSYKREERWDLKHQPPTGSSLAQPSPPPPYVPSHSPLSSLPLPYPSPLSPSSSSPTSSSPPKPAPP